MLELVIRHSSFSRKYKDFENDFQLPMQFKTYPVIVFLEGEMFTHGNPSKYSAEDLAAEGNLQMFNVIQNGFNLCKFKHNEISIIPCIYIAVSQVLSSFRSTTASIFSVSRF